MAPTIQRHPGATFFVLAFAITWVVWVPRAAASQALLASDLPIVVGQVWSWRPAIAALLAASLTEGRAAVRELGAAWCAGASAGSGICQQIAAVGTSGNSLWPHLHFHVQDSPDLDQQARTVPVVLSDILLIRNGRESTPAAADLRRGDKIRRIDRTSWLALSANSLAATRITEGSEVEK